MPTFLVRGLGAVRVVGWVATQSTTLFLHTRYPERRIHFYNAGVSGDKAGDALARFEGDVALQKPKYVSVLLGMNDGIYRHFDREAFRRIGCRATNCRRPHD